MKINRNFLYILIILAFILTVSVFYFNSLVKNMFYRTIELDMNLKVSNYTGFNVDTDKVYFGTIPRGGSGIRVIVIHNSDIESKVIIEKKGELSNWVYFDEANFLMAPNEVRNITLNVNVPKDAEYGDYTGRLKILFMLQR